MKGCYFKMIHCHLCVYLYACPYKLMPATEVVLNRVIMPGSLIFKKKNSCSRQQEVITEYDAVTM